MDLFCFKRKKEGWVLCYSSSRTKIKRTRACFVVMMGGTSSASARISISVRPRPIIGTTVAMADEL